MNIKTGLAIAGYLGELAICSVAAVGIFKVTLKEMHIKPLKEDYMYDLEDEIDDMHTMHAMNLNGASNLVGGLDSDIEDEDDDR